MVKVFCDGSIEVKNVDGYTFNPTLMKGTKNYSVFGRYAAKEVFPKPISFEVIADDLGEMNEQAIDIASWGENVYVKIPVMDTQGTPTTLLIYNLSRLGIKVNVTAVFTSSQIHIVARSLWPKTPSIISIFAGRIADTGKDPVPLFYEAMRVKHANTETLWASTREVYNYYQAQQCGADIITMSPDLIKKLSLKDKDLTEYSRETVKQFYEDGKGLSL